MQVQDEIYSDVIVIGAGLAGLACASEIQRKSKLSVTVLEARERVGGRVHTIDSHGSDEDTPWPCPIEMGAQWAHHFKSHHPLAVLAKQAGMTFREHNWDDVAGVYTGIDRRAKLIPGVEVDTVAAIYHEIYAKAAAMREKKWGKSVCLSFSCQHFGKIENVSCLSDKSVRIYDCVCYGVCV